MQDYLKQQWRYLLGAFGLHALFAALFGLTMVGLSRPPQMQQMAIQAVVVDASTVDLSGAPIPAPAPEPQPQPAPDPVPVPEPEPQPRVDEQAEQRRREAEQQEQQRRETEQRQAQEREQERRQREQAEQQRRQEEQVLRERQEAERKQAEAEAAKKRAAEEAERKRREEEQRAAEIKKRQEEEAARRRVAEEARQQQAREDELRRQLAEEEGLMAVRGSAAMNQYITMIQQHVSRRWTRPLSASGNIECEVRVSQTPAGVVLSVQIGRCNGDAAVRQSIETAVHRASPLPPPPDPRLFDRNLVFIFKPTG